MSVIQNFNQEISNAIKAYQAKVKTVTDERKEDIKKLEAIFRNSWTSLGDYIFAVESFISQLKTGIGFFQTGNSKLIDELMKVLNLYNDPVIRLLIKMEKSNQGQEDSVINYLDKLTQFIGFMKASNESRKSLESYRKERNENKKSKNCRSETINYENLVRAR